MPEASIARSGNETTPALAEIVAVFGVSRPRYVVGASRIEIGSVNQASRCGFTRPSTASTDTRFGLAGWNASARICCLLPAPVGVRPTVSGGDFGTKGSRQLPVTVVVSVAGAPITGPMLLPGGP